VGAARSWEEGGNGGSSEAPVGDKSPTKTLVDESLRTLGVIGTISKDDRIPSVLARKLREGTSQVFGALHSLHSRISAVKSAECELEELYVLKEEHAVLEIEHSELRESHSAVAAELDKLKAAVAYLKVHGRFPITSPGLGEVGDCPPSTPQPMEVESAGKATTPPPVRTSPVREVSAPLDLHFMEVLKEISAAIADLRAEVGRLSALVSTPPPFVRIVGRTKG